MWGDNILVQPIYYGGTYNLFGPYLPRQGVEARIGAYDDFAAFRSLN